MPPTRRKSLPIRSPKEDMKKRDRDSKRHEREEEESSRPMRCSSGAKPMTRNRATQHMRSPLNPEKISETLTKAETSAASGGPGKKRAYTVMNDNTPPVRSKPARVSKAKVVNETIFSEDDALVILQEIYSFYKTSGDPKENFKKDMSSSGDLSGFCNHLKPKIMRKPSIAQVKNKIYNLRNSLANVSNFVVTAEGGLDMVVIHKRFQLWKQIWGAGGLLDEQDPHDEDELFKNDLCLNCLGLY
ncbi:predicted protein [Arabidopsis lyrata subsp. lyrata]|uniref:Predicted protein n=1 Tax=Arabidopsis lyrata subsp. lyrata TaxID=81972 RepID=D7MK88_ARALL|nr:GLABROUS1 enhancer-binding protein-like [Arabidopsis lyrata subsp. lyrata]EFH45089.1 predicted protein [Arabidopsis lyrata subsp. lyrata]|eukprot:XP_002868830.1 GLABROUS1 enhancer-binding protein-like [Arabidopsis lyrata subsp. lyrata]